MIRSVLILIGSAIALAGCASLPAPRHLETAKAASCAPGAARLGPTDACRPFTHTYTSEQLRRTGQFSLPQALQMLDPSITVRGGQ